MARKIINTLPPYFDSWIHCASEIAKTNRISIEKVLETGKVKHAPSIEYEGRSPFSKDGNYMNTPSEPVIYEIGEEYLRDALLKELLSKIPRNEEIQTGIKYYYLGKAAHRNQNPNYPHPPPWEAQKDEGVVLLLEYLEKATNSFYSSEPYKEVKNKTELSNRKSYLLGAEKGFNKGIYQGIVIGTITTSIALVVLFMIIYI